jgi:hypothetical protein
MQMINLLTIYSGEQTASGVSGIGLVDIITIGVSLFTLLLNILFYIIIAPRIDFKYKRKEEFFKQASEFIQYLAKVNSLDKFDGVLTKIKDYCISIKLLFVDGEAPKHLSACMEGVYASVKKRKDLNDEKEIKEWEEDFKIKTRELRIALAKYTGIF